MTEIKATIARAEILSGIGRHGQAISEIDKNLHKVSSEEKLVLLSKKEEILALLR